MAQELLSDNILLYLNRVYLVIYTMCVFKGFWPLDNISVTFDWSIKSVGPEQFPMQNQYIELHMLKSFPFQNPT